VSAGMRTSVTRSFTFEAAGHDICKRVEVTRD
jgi:hypothetical protein